MSSPAKANEPTKHGGDLSATTKRQRAQGREQHRAHMQNVEDFETMGENLRQQTGRDVSPTNGAYLADRRIVEGYGDLAALDDVNHVHQDRRLDVEACAQGSA